MKVIYGINKIKRYKKPVVALGVFDGVHWGHRNILENTVAKAGSIKGTSVVLTFWPHPQKEESLYSLEHRLRLINELGIDVCIVINFNKNFAKISAIDFIRNILVKKIGAYYIYVGKNFKFGKDTEGDIKVLDVFSKIYNFKLKVFEVIKVKNRPVSSTYIRALIKKGDLVNAQRLLTRPVSILGTVIRGSSLATKLGFPTANINPHHEVIPPSGVYAVRIILNGKKRNGACNIGTKPTFETPCLAGRQENSKLETQNSKHIEVHIFNFRKKIYGKYLEIQFIRKIRQEKKFPSHQHLAAQIQKDVLAVKQIFSLH